MTVVPTPTPLLDAGSAAVLLSLLERLAMARSLEAITAAVRGVARQLVRADGVTFVLRDGDKCHYVDEDAIAPLWKGCRFPLETCISGWVMLHREPVAIEDIYADPRIPHQAYRPTFVHSLAMVPVRREDPVAAIGAYWARHRRVGPEEIQLLEMIANAAAVAITNVALYESLRRAAEEARVQAVEAERQSAVLARVNAELEHANLAKDRFLSAASHDLRQPFQAMRLFHGVLSRGPRPQDIRALEKLGEAMAEGEQLLHALLDVSTLQVGIVRPTFDAVPLDQVLGRVEAAHADVAVAKRLVLRVARSGRTVVTDPVLLLRMLNNLVGNAIKYTETGAVLVCARRQGEAVRIEVRDSGPGIPAALRDEVFEDFFQLGNPERDRRNGLGLGLGIVRRLGRVLDHAVGLRSEPGRGSVFSVVVPAV